MEEWVDPSNVLGSLVVSNQEDHRVWMLEGSRLISTKSLVPKLMNSRDYLSLLYSKSIWRVKIPKKKVEVFLWILAHEKFFFSFF